MHASTLSPQWSATEARLPPPSRRRLKYSDKAGVKRNHCEADPPRDGYRYLTRFPPSKMWHKAVLREKPGTDRDPCRASSKIACFLWTLIQGAMKVPLMRSTGAREYPLPTVVGNRSRLPPPSHRRPKHSDKAGVERNHCEADPPRDGYSYLSASHQAKYGTRPFYVGSPAQIETHAGPSSKIACFL